MAELMRVRVRWTGWTGGPGVSTHFVTGTDPTAALTALNAWYEKIKASIAGGITITVPGSGDIIEETDGSLTGQWSHGSDTVHTNAGGATYAAASGALVQWHTSTIHNRRRLQGHTFIVPMASGNFDANGQISAAIAAGMTTDANTCVSAAANTLAVWGRPGSDPTKPNYKTGGTHGQITTAAVPTRSAVLRSRRA